MAANEFLKIFTKRKELVQWIEDLEERVPGDRAHNEIAGGIVDGANVIFSTANEYEPGTLHVHLNGLRDLDFVEVTSTTFQLTSSFIPMPAGGGAEADVVHVDYEMLKPIC
jgi:hypothetical protein